MAVSAKAFSTRLGARLQGAPVGSVFDDLLAFIKELIPIIVTLPCFAASKSKMQANIDEQFRAVVKKKKGKTPAKVRRLMKKHGVDDSDDQDSAWAEITAEAFADSSNVAQTLVESA